VRAHVRSRFDVAAVNDDGSWPPYSSLGQEAGGCVLFAVINWTLSLVSLGGLCRLALRRVRGQPMHLVDAFPVGPRVLPLVGLGLVTFVPVAVSLSLCVLPACVLTGQWMFAPLEAADDGAGAVAALRRSGRLVGTERLHAVPFAPFGLLFAYAGSMLFVVGAVLTYPAAVIAPAIAYDRRAPAVAQPYGRSDVSNRLPTGDERRP
jgi:hypothetical protein